MIEFRGASVTYADAQKPVLDDVNLQIPEGELCLVVGPTGSGKSTLLGCVNGHVPHFTGGTLLGDVLVDGRNTREWRPRDLADVVGVVGQDPAHGFVTDRVADELAYTMESLGLPPSVMRRRVEDTLDLLGLVELRDRPLATLSGGQQQRVAIGAALTAHPKVLILDEPTSALDPAAAEEVLAALHRLVHDLSVTVLLAEHRLERVIGDADSLILVPGGGARLVWGRPAELMSDSPVAPPVVELGRLAGWTPLPMTVRDARRLSGGLREKLSIVGRVVAPSSGEFRRPPNGTDHKGRRGSLETVHRLVVDKAIAGFERHQPVVGAIDLTVMAGEVIAVMGRNGAGKSTLLWTIAGSMKPFSGSVRIDGTDPGSLRPADRRSSVALVPQQPADLLYRSTVAAELDQADTESRARPGTAGRLLADIAPGISADQHPRDLSEGQRLALVLAIQLSARPALLLLDEPTRGLDYPAKRRLTTVLHQLAAAGTAVILASHDVEFVAGCCERVAILADGRLIADGPSAEVVTSSPTYAPQVAKILAPLAFLTVDEVKQAMAESV